MEIRGNKAYFDREFYYTEEYLPTPRCRKLRKREAVGCAETFVPVFQGEEAPVAFSRLRDFGEDQYVQEYRLFGDTLYTRLHNSDYYCLNGTPRRWATVEDLERCITKRTYIYDRNWNRIEDLETCQSIITAGNDSYAIMVEEGQLCVMGPAFEPMYEVCTFGLGHNHGSTAVMVMEHYNENVSASRYFNALQYEEAIAEATRIAEARKDTESLPRLRNEYNFITVYMPEAVHRNPAVDHEGGSDFLNALESLTETAGSATEAGLLAMCLAASNKSE